MSSLGTNFTLPIQKKPLSSALLPLSLKKLPGTTMGSESGIGSKTLHVR
jgi:hypothetical protein